MGQELDSVSTYSDGGSRGNPGPSAIGVIVYSPDGKLIANHRGYIGGATNNQAEYAAVLKALELAREFTKGAVSCYSDSMLLVNQLSGRFKVKNPGIREAIMKVKRTEKAFATVTYTHLPRTDPKMKLADALVNRALDEQSYL